MIKVKLELGKEIFQEGDSLLFNGKIKGYKREHYFEILLDEFQKFPQIGLVELLREFEGIRIHTSIDSNLVRYLDLENKGFDVVEELTKTYYKLV